MHFLLRLAASVCLCVAGTTLLAACGGFSRTAVTHLQQAGVVAPPATALAASPLVRPGGVAVEGGLDGAFGPFSPDDPNAAHPAHVVPLVGAHARVFYRPARHFELGTGGTVFLPGAAASTARDLDEGTFGHPVTGRFDLQGRLIFNPDSPVRVGWTFGFGLTSVPFIQAGVTTDTGTTFFWEDRSFTSSSTSMWSRDGSFIEAQFLSALFVAGDPHPRVGLIGGLLLENQRVLPAASTDVRSCSTSALSCDVTRPQDDRPGKTLAALLAFVGAELRFGPLSLVGRVHVVFPTDPLISQAGMLGGALDARYTFGR